MKTRKNMRQKGGDFDANMQQMQTQNTSGTQAAAPAPETPTAAPPATAQTSAPSASQTASKKGNTGFFGNLFGQAEKTAEKDMTSLANIASKPSATTETTKRAAPCKSIRDQVLERAVAIDAEITSAQTQLAGLIKLVKADTNNPTGKSGKSDGGLIPGLADLNPFAGGGKKRRGKKTRGKKRTIRKRPKSRRHH
tara:strand:+ start:7735 stop:8319 length:585 start_codon:yes stop_codon:yes gene_type:complete